jgi:hypothetical protein
MFVSINVLVCVWEMWVVGCAVIFTSKWNEAKRKRRFFASMPFLLVFASLWKHRNLKQNKNEMKRKTKWRGSKNCRHFRFEEKWSKSEAKFCCFFAKKVFFHLFLHMKQNENEMKWKKTKKNWKLQREKDKVKFWDILSRNEENINPKLSGYINWRCHAARSCIWLLRQLIGEEGSSSCFSRSRKLRAFT